MGVSVEVYLEALLTASADWQTAEEQINSAATKVNETLPDCGDLGEGVSETATTFIQNWFTELQYLRGDADSIALALQDAHDSYLSIDEQTQEKIASYLPLSESDYRVDGEV